MRKKERRTGAVLRNFRRAKYENKFGRSSPGQRQKGFGGDRRRDGFAKFARLKELIFTRETTARRGDVVPAAGDRSNTFRSRASPPLVGRRLKKKTVKTSIRRTPTGLRGPSLDSIFSVATLFFFDCFIPRFPVSFCSRVGRHGRVSGP